MNEWDFAKEGGRELAVDYLGALHTMAEGRGAVVSTNHIARNQEFGLSTLHTRARVQKSSQFKMITFLYRQRTLEGSLGWTGMETQTMVKRPLDFFTK